MPYEFLEDVATADIAFKAWGKSLEETFVAAAEATLNVMIEELDSIEPRQDQGLELEHEDLDLLLFDLLQELIYYKDSERLLLRVTELQIKPGGQGYLLHGVARGETLDAKRHQQRVDVKAVTLHRFWLQKVDQGWEAQVILDI